MRLLIVDDDPQDRETVEQVAVKAGHRVQTAEDGVTAVQFAEAEPYDVALVDLGMTGMDGIATIQALRRQCPDLRLLVVSGFDDPGHVLQALGAGADGYVLKTETTSRLPAAIDEAMNGGGPMSAKIARYVIDAFRSASNLNAPSAAPATDEAGRVLSPREWEVLDGLAKKQTYGEIAAQLGISLNTVRHHIRNLYGKLGVTGKAEALIRAAKQK